VSDVPTRHIHKSSWRCQDDVKELLQAVFVGEALAPSRCLWLVSPWISDIAVVDNRAGAFDALDSSWGQRLLRLSELLARNLRLGSTVVVATRPVTHNTLFLDQLAGMAAEFGVASALRVNEAEELHEKGLLGDDFYLGGSMNLTYGGVELLEETVTFDTAPSVVAEARLTFYERWGGDLPRTLS